MKLLVAVSGGVDSVVLLDMLTKTSHQLVVAHFDHGIRDDSQADARFVAGLAERYGLPFVSRREELGEGASEERARDRRYAFLRTQAAEHGCKLVTAHHSDDGVETVALNILRGTGWRGLAVFGDKTIIRPLVKLSKNQLYTYALRHRLEWIEDTTNNEATYTRNRIRARLSKKLATTEKKRLTQLWHRQAEIRDLIDQELARYVAENSRYFMTMIDPAVACEILNFQLKCQRGAGATRPQLARLLLAIKVGKPGAMYDCGGGGILEVKKTEYLVRS